MGVFVAMVFAGGKVTIPQHLRDLLGIRDDDYVRVTITEVMKKTADRKTVKEKTRVKSPPKKR